MKYIQANPNPSWAYPAPQSNAFPGCLPLTDGQAAVLVQYNGFVTITQEPDEEIEGSSVTVTPGLEACEEWKASLPPDPEPEPPAPTLDERVTALETEKASQADVDELNEDLNMILTGVTE